ncbi:CXADR-like membrane protein isoform X1 [Mytilus edulis]|uniref:CXADR-like membrane protein isoform X1 n=1 Tax=Mytilus edulis TaxID=6550 RepID=UPI0039EE20CD
MNFQYQNINNWILICSYIYGFSTAIHTVIGHVDSAIILNCTLDGTITWYGPAKNPPPHEADYSWKNQLNKPKIPDDLRPRLSVVGDFDLGRFNLKIERLKVKDQGLYKCELKGSVDKFRLKVIGDLTVEVSKTSYVGEIGGSVNLGCAVTSKTSPVNHVGWYFLYQSNGSYILLKPNETKYSKTTPKNPSMTIQKLELSDDGLYICSATNKAGVTGNSTTSTHLTVINNDKPGSTGKKIA